ncbi:MAG: monovalent cation/H(+) antiporter subunit G [Acidimicrobiia bacterium]
MIEWLSGFLMIVGALLALLAAIGLHRFDNVLARMHAATKPATLGLVLIAVGASLQLTDSGDSVKLFLVVVFQFFTAPIAAHLIGRAAYRSVVEVANTIRIDELAGDSVDER